MQIASQLTATLKREMKARGITYAGLAERIGLSEASVKRMFSQQNFTLERLDQVLAACGIEFDELAAAMRDDPPVISHLSREQERDVVADPRLFIVAVSALNHITAAQMSELYALSEAEVTACLLQLDRIGFLRLLPNNRIRLLVSRTFRWLPDGPIMAHVRELAAGDFLDSRFDGDGETLQLVSVMLSPRVLAQFGQRLHQLAEEISRAHQDEARLPYAQRDAVSFLLAARPWVPRAFRAFLRRKE